MERGDIYRVSLNPTQGYEQSGMRPVMVVSPRVFNQSLNTPLVVPITNGGGAARVRGFTVPLEGTGLATTGYVLCNQVRALDIGARNGQLLETAPQHVVDEVLAKLATLIS